MFAVETGMGLCPVEAFTQCVDRAGANITVDHTQYRNGERCKRLVLGCRLRLVQQRRVLGLASGVVVAARAHVSFGLFPHDVGFSLYCRFE